MIRLLVDSGAYSAWQQRATIKLEAYIAFLQSSTAHIEHYVSLDVIAGNGQRTLDAHQIKRAASRSYDNHQRMKKVGLSPIPVFHQDDPFEWLQRYVSDGENYIGIAAHGGHAHNDIPWFDRCFALIPSSVRVHGFGQTTPSILRHFPFTSVDSRTWLQAASFARLTIPIYHQGKPAYRHRAQRVAVGDRSTCESDHISRLGPLRREQVEHFLTEVVGVTIEQVNKSHQARWRVCAAYFTGLAAACGTTLYFVTRVQHQLRAALLSAGAQTHLLSYYYEHGQDLDRYVSA
jgi:hypothetical protein